MKIEISVPPKMVQRGSLNPLDVFKVEGSLYVVTNSSWFKIVYNGLKTTHHCIGLECGTLKYGDPDEEVEYIGRLKFTR